MDTDAENFEINRWHSSKYVEFWMSDNIRESERKMLRQKLVSFLPFDPAASIRILDLGAGAGGLSFEVLSAYPNAQLVCQDFSEAMLAQAQKKLSPFSRQVTLVKSDLRDPRWQKVIPGTFEVVVSSLVMHTVSDRVREIYQAVYSLVNSGGCFLIGDNFTPAGPAIEKVYLKARLKDYQARIKADIGIEKSLEEVAQELRQQRQNQRQAFPERRPGRPQRSLSLINNLEWLSQSSFDEMDCLWKDQRRAIIGGFRH